MSKNSTITNKTGTHQSSDSRLTHIDLEHASVVHIHEKIDQVETFIHKGNDLTVVFKNGETITIANFYTRFERNLHSDLVLDSDNDATLWHLQSEEVSSASKLSNVGFEQLDKIDPLLVNDHMAIPLWGIAGAIGATGVGIALLSHKGHDSNGSHAYEDTGKQITDTTTTDTTTSGGHNVIDIVNKPTVTIAPTRGHVGDVLTGTTEAGATVTLDVNGDGQPDYTTTADGDGKWQIPLTEMLTNGTSVTATASDAVGNTSVPATTIVDQTAPVVTIEPTRGHAGDVLTGTTEAGATVTLDVNGDGQPDYTTTADGDGKWQVPLTETLTNGTQVTATASDAVGNISVPATTIVDQTAPVVTIEPTRGHAGDVLTGITEAGATVTLDVNGDGQPDYTTTADGDGKWQVPLTETLTNGTQVTATASDAVGNISVPATTTVVDQTIPVVTIDQIRSHLIDMVMGTTEAGGTTVTLDVNGDGHPDYTTISDSKGDWHINLKEGEIYGLINFTYTSTNTDGGVGLFLEAYPAGYNFGNKVTGTTEPNLTVNVDVNGDGVPDYTTTADSDGRWSVELSTTLTEGMVISAIATDAAGNASKPATTTVTQTGPSVTIDPTRGQAGDVVTGTTDVGATVALDVNGDGVQDYTTTADSNGKWQIPLTETLANGTPVTAVANDVIGTTSTPVTTVVGQAALVVTIDATRGQTGDVLTGTTGAGAKVTVDVNSDGQPDYTTTADGAGKWQVALTETLTNGSSVTATASDAAGNTSVPATTAVDQTAPEVTIDATRGQAGDVLTGTTEAGAKVTVDVNGDGQPDYTTTADGTGKWQVALTETLTNGTAVTATASDAAGNNSTPATTHADQSAPVITIEPTQGRVYDQILGNTSPGAKVSVDTNGDGQPDYTTTADSKGYWHVNMNGGEADNFSKFVISGTSADGSESVQVNTDPVILNFGDKVTGTTEPNLTVNVDVNGDGEPDYTTSADSDGNWSVELRTTLAEGTVVSATATDAAGNVSKPATTTVDQTAPSVTIDQTQGNEGDILTGTTEAGANVAVDVNSDGQPDYTATADDTGHWSVPLTHALAAGTEISATASDVAGNTSTPATTYVEEAEMSAASISAADGLEMMSYALNMVNSDSLLNSDTLTASAVKTTANADSTRSEGSQGTENSDQVVSVTSGEENATTASSADHTLYATDGSHTYLGSEHTTGSETVTAETDAVDYSHITSSIDVNMNTTSGDGLVSKGATDTDTLTGIDKVTGTDQNDTFTAGNSDITFEGRGGNDTFNLNASGGHTSLLYQLLDGSDATGGNGHDTVNHFSVGDVSTSDSADVINIKALLTDYQGTASVHQDAETHHYVLDTTSSDLQQYVQVATSGNDTVLSVDLDGAGSQHTMAPLVTLHDQQADLATLLANHQLIVA